MISLFKYLLDQKKLDIDTYLSNLNDKAVKQKNSLLQNQTYEYIEYLRKLIEVAQIMKKGILYNNSFW